jgi:hypothetical protein
MRTSEYRSQLRSESLEKQVTSSPDLSATGIADATLSKDRTHGPDRVVVHSILAGIILAMFLSALEQTIVAPALPAIGKSLADVDDLPWVVTAYLLAATAATPLFGKLSDIHGRQPFGSWLSDAVFRVSAAAALYPWRRRSLPIFFRRASGRWLRATPRSCS